MAGREQQGGRLRPAEQAKQTTLQRFFRRHKLDLPIRLAGFQLFCQGFDQEFRAERSGFIPRVGNSEEGCLAGEAQRTGLLCSDHAARVLGVLVQGCEINPPGSVRHIQLELEAIRHGLRVADDQQIIGDRGRLNRTRGSAVTREEIVLGIPRAVAVTPYVFFVERAGLRLSLRQQLAERLPDSGNGRRIPGSREDHPPTRLHEVLRVKPGFQGESRFFDLGAAEF